MSEDKKVPANIYELMDKIAQEQSEQKKQLDLLGRAIVELADKGKQQQPQQSGGGLGDLIKALKEVSGEGGGKTSLKEIGQMAAYMARLADVVDHYRHPSLPYSPADKFLMKEGARRVYEMRYHGVKNVAESAPELPSDEQLERELGFTREEKKEEAEEKKHV